MSDRDFTGDMTAYLKDHLPDGDYVTPLLAADLVRDLQVTDPDLLAGWLMQRAPQLLAVTIRGMRAEARAAMRRSQPRTRFGKASARALAEGSSNPLRNFLEESKHEVRNQVNRKLGDMNARDCLFVAESYRKQSHTLAFEAVFFEVLARRIGSGTVRDSYTNEELQGLRAEITSAYAPEIA